MKNVLRTFHEKLIFVKFHTILLEKDEMIGIHYPVISLIQLGYISENFELNIEATCKFESFWFNEFWINYRRTSGTFAVKRQGDILYIWTMKSVQRAQLCYHHKRRYASSL